MEYINGEKTGLNKYETKVSQKLTMRSSERGLESLEVERVMTRSPKPLQVH